MRRLVLLMVLATAPACGEGLDVYSRIEDLRVLAMQAEPPEFFYDQSTDVTFSALVADPDHGSVDYAWRFCPVDSKYGCDDFAEKLDLARDAITSEGDLLNLRDTARDPATGSASVTRLPAHQPGADRIAELAIPTFVMTQGQLADTEDYYRNVGFYGFGMGGWPLAVLTVDDGDDHLIAEKRLTVARGDYSLYNAVLEESLGYRFCTAGETEADGCLDFTNVCVDGTCTARAPNQNPVFARKGATLDPRIGVHKGKRSDRDFRDADLLETLEAGKSMRILPYFTDESFEPFLVLKGDLESREIFVEQEQEDISVAWFCTAGELHDELTWPKFTKTLDTYYTAPDDPPKSTNGIVTIWMVARDHRGGEAWEHLDIKIE
jgi:hypothetical protein